MASSIFKERKKTVFKSVGIPYTVVYNKWGEAIL